MAYFGSLNLDDPYEVIINDPQGRSFFQYGDYLKADGSLWHAPVVYRDDGPAQHVANPLFIGTVGPMPLVTFLPVAYFNVVPATNQAGALSTQTLPTLAAMLDAADGDWIRRRTQALGVGEEVVVIMDLMVRGGDSIQLADADDASVTFAVTPAAVTPNNMVRIALTFSCTAAGTSPTFACDAAEIGRA